MVIHRIIIFTHEMYSRRSSNFLITNCKPESDMPAVSVAHLRFETHWWTTLSPTNSRK